MSNTDRERREPRKTKVFFYYDRLAPVLSKLDDNHLGQWFRAVMEYELYGSNIPTGDPVTDVFIDMAITDLDLALDAFQASCKRNKDNRNKGRSSEEEDSPEAQRRFRELTSNW